MFWDSILLIIYRVDNEKLHHVCISFMIIPEGFNIPKWTLHSTIITSDDITKKLEKHSKKVFL